MSKVKKVNKKILDTLRVAMYKAGCDADLYNDDNIVRLDHLISLARKHHKLAEIYCNGDLTEAQEKRQETIERTISAYALCFNLTVKFDGDPRGFTVKLHAPKGNMSNTWGGAESGYGI